MSARFAMLALLAVAPAASRSAPASVAGPFAGPVLPSALAEACRGRDGWADAAPPARVFGNVYDVGSCGVMSLLVTSAKGHILLDGGSKDAAAGIAANVARLGYRMRDVRVLLNSHEHLDHAGGLAELKRLSGARLLARAEARGALERGAMDPDDPQAAMGGAFPAVRVDATLVDGQVVAVGPLRLTAHATPGHSAGSTSWTWTSCQGRTCRRMVYADSLTATSGDGYRFADHPAYVAAFRRTLDRVAALPCDLLVTPHPAASRFFERMTGTLPLIDQRGCAGYAAAARAKLDARLAGEGARAS